MESKVIKKKLLKVFPNLEVPWLRDKEYELPLLSDVEEFVKDSKVDEYHFIGEDFDCDDFALQLHAEVKRKHHWAFGEAFGDKINGIPILHNLNIFISSNGNVYLLEPQTDEIWKAVKGQDNILIIGM